MMKKTFAALSVFFKRSFACFSLIALAFAIVGKIISGNELLKYISVDFVLSFFAFSVLFALSFFLADFIKNAILRRFLKFVLTYSSFSLVFFAGGAFENYVLSNAIQNKAFSVLAISFIFVIIYVIIGLVALACSAVKVKLDDSNKEYDKMF